MNYTYDNVGQLKTAQGFESDQVTPRLQEQFGYAYDKAWNLNTRTNNILRQTFVVNNLNELSSASRSGTLTVAGTTTEPGANVTSVTVNTSNALIYADGTFASTNQPLANGYNTYTAIAHDNVGVGRWDTNSLTVNLPASASYSYDLNGNLTNDGTRNFAYDDENQLTAVWVANTWSNSFGYDGLLRERIEKDYTWTASAWQETNEVRFIYDGYLVIQERDWNNLPQVSYTRGVDLSGSLQGAGGIGGLLARTSNAQLLTADPNASAYYFSDGQGNVVAMVNYYGALVAQYQYDPFGNLLVKSGPQADANRYRFSSKEWDDGPGLYYYGFRFYDPNLQRWLNRDPIQEIGGVNLYGFLLNSPINFVDWFGLCNAMTDIYNENDPDPYMADLNRRSNQALGQSANQMENQLAAEQRQAVATAALALPIAVSPVGELAEGLAAWLGARTLTAEAIGVGVDEAVGQGYSKATGYNGAPITVPPKNVFQAAEEAFDMADYLSDPGESLGTGNGQNPLTGQSCANCNVNSPSIYMPPSNPCN